MKSRNERLSEHLLQTDDAILNTAYEIDDPEKLKAYKKTQSAPITLLPRRAVWIPIVAAAACVALTVGLWQGGVFGSEKLPVEAPNEGTTTEVATPTDTDVVTEPTDEPDADATTDGTADTTTDTQHPDKTDTTNPTATDKTDPTKTEKPTTSVTDGTDKTEPTKNTTTGKDKPTTKSTTKTEPTKTTPTTEKNKVVITGDSPDIFGNNSEAGVLMSLKDECLSPALQKQMSIYRDMDVFYSVIVELPDFREDSNEWKKSVSEELAQLEEENRIAGEAFDEEAKRLDPSYDGRKAKIWSDKLHALDDQIRSISARHIALMEQGREYLKNIRDERVKFLKEMTGSDLIPIITDTRYYPNIALDHNYVFFMELTAEEINILVERGGYVIRMKYPEGDRPGMYVE